MAYVILSFVEERPVDNQPYWDLEYARRTTAVGLARIQHNILSNVEDINNLYTIVVEKDMSHEVQWIIYRGVEIGNKIEATKLAERLYGEEI